jgi:putative nucleotidyltransferase with HDIG domain
MRFSGFVVLYVLSVIAAFGLLLVIFASQISWHQLPQVLLFILLIIVASYLIVEDPAGGTLSSASTLFYVAIYVFNPITALFVVALGYAIGNTLPRNWVAWRVFFNAAQMGISAFLGAQAYRILGGGISAGFGLPILAAVAGPVTHQIINNLLVAVLVSQVRRLPLVRTWLSFVREFVWSNLLSIPTAVLIALLYIRVHPAFILFFLASLPFQRWATSIFLQARGTYMRVIESLVRATELSLPGMKGHARRVADLSVAVAREIGLSDRDIDLVEFAALLHDVGMIGFDDMLSSGEAYTEVTSLLDKHAVIGAEIAAELPRSEVSEIVRYHHRGSSAQPVGGRHSLAFLGSGIVALAEEVDSRTFGLFPYRERYSPRAVLEYVVRHRGSVFDAAVVDAFLRVVSRGELSFSGAADAAGFLQLGSKA